MKLLLLLREDFITIFKKTFADYLSNNFDWQGDINWISKFERSQKKYLLVNQRLNLIYPCNLNRAFLYPLKSEYVYHKNPIRHALHNLYANLATCFTLERLFSTAFNAIEPWEKEIENFCIIQGIIQSE